MNVMCKGMKQWDEDKIFFGDNISEKFCKADGSVITIEFDDEKKILELNKKIKFAIKNSKNEKFEIKELFFQNFDLNSTKFRYNFGIVETKTEINELGILFLNNRVIKIDNGEGKIKILKEPNEKIYLLNLRINVRNILINKK